MRLETFAAQFSSITLILLVAAVMLFTSTAALECYVCNGFDHDDCDGTKLDEYKQTCNSSDSGCRKWWFSYTVNNVHKTRTNRDCAESMPSPKCYKGHGAGGKQVKRVVCDCENDLCNKATGPSINSSILVFGIVLILFFNAT